MKIELRIFSSYRKPVADLLGIDTSEEIQMELPEGSRLVDLLVKVGLEKEKAIIGIINGTRQFNDYPLTDGDRIGLFPPIGRR